MLRRTLTITLALLLLSVLGCVASAAAAESPGDAADLTRGERRDAIELAQSSSDVRTRLALRPVAYDIRVVAVDPAEVTSISSLARTGRHARVVWLQDGTPRVTAVVDLEQHRVIMVQGQALNVMPGLRSVALEAPGDASTILSFLAAFAACLLFGPRDRWWSRWVVAPLLLIAIACAWTLLNVLDRDSLRMGSIVQYGLPVVTLAVAAVAWARASTRELRWHPSRVPAAVWLVVATMATAAHVWVGRSVRLPIDVAYASDAGARLMVGGVSVYGNVLDLPGFLLHGDTYGPIAYLAYVPGVLLTDDTANLVLATNVALGAAVAALFVLLGWRAGDVRGGAWAAAAWSTCPMTMLSVSAGHNDVVMAAAIMGAVCVASRPAWRGALLAVAAATKLLPVLLLPGMVRHPRDPARPQRRVLAGFLLLSVAVWGIGWGGPSGFAAFIDGIRYQSERDDIASVWGLLGIGPARYVLLAGAVALAAHAARRSSKATASGQLLLAVAPFALALVALPQFWFSYLVALLPPLLALPLRASMPDERRQARRA